MVTDFSSKDEIHAAPGDARNWHSSLLLSPGSRSSCGCIRGKPRHQDRQQYLNLQLCTHSPSGSGAEPLSCVAPASLEFDFARTSLS